MNGLWRVVRMALRYKFTLVGVIFSSLIVAVLWSSNIGVVYPFFQVAFLGKTMQQWAADEAADLEREVAKSQVQIEDLERQLPNLADPARGRKQNEIEVAKIRREVAQKGLTTMRRLQPWIERFVPRAPFPTVLLMVSVLFVGSLVKDFFLVVNMVLVERLVQRVVLDLRKQFYRQTLRLDQRAFGQHGSGELMASFVTDIGCLSIGLNTIIGKCIREPLRMLTCLVGAAYVSWQLLLFSLLIAPPCLLMMSWLSKALKRNSRKALDQISTMFTRISETFGGMQTVRAFTAERYERRRFHDATKAIYQVSMKVSFYTALAKPVTELFGIGVIAIALLAGAHLVLNQTTNLFGIPMCERPMSAAALAVFFGWLAGMSDPARKLADVFGSLQTGAAAAERLFPLLDRQPTINDPPVPRTAPRPHHRLVFDAVQFHYRPEQPVLRGVSLEIPFGETLAIVGPNGCGKSTLVNLLLRFYDPHAGAIQIDGVDLRDMRQRDLRQRIGIVSQATHLFDDTVASNIRYGTPGASDPEIIAAAKQAHAHRFILDKLSDGYETRVGQSGSRLSGGQRQRIALARAILRNPDILILDEATSQIDIESEQLIHEALQKFITGRSAIMITHRLSTLSLADRIAVMDAGQIIDLGTHHQLMTRCGLYQRLHEVQFKQSA